MSESMPARIERIARDHNISLREAHRVARIEVRMEKAKAERKP